MQASSSKARQGKARQGKGGAHLQLGDGWLQGMQLRALLCAQRAAQHGAQLRLQLLLVGGQGLGARLDVGGLPRLENRVG